ncbi:30S ribosomal protein S17e [Candidatus Woesearchaeota archaeon]|nr:30S ribosomal protein S17e [Candidatus Woesearchaeota archaeon]
MGRIKTKLIKRTVNKLIKDYESRFSDNFDNNKKAVLEVLEVESKKLKNIVAGYITKLMRREAA